MSDTDRERWDTRYATAELVMGHAPKPLVLELAAALPCSGRALDIASGEGQLAAWLAQRGLDVTAVDISSVGLDKLRNRAAEEGYAARIHAIEADLDAGLPELEPGLDLVTCVDFYAPPIIAQARGLLAPGGLLLVQVLLQPSDGDSPHRAIPGAALELAAGLQLQFYRQGMIGGRWLAQLLAQRPPVTCLEFSS